MESISLEKFYEEVKNNEPCEKISVEISKCGSGSFKIRETLGKGCNGYVFLALDKNKFAALRMSYEKDDFEEKLKTVRMIMGDEYRKYLLELLHPSILTEHFFRGKEKTSFNKDVYVSTWEPADSTLIDKLEESFENKLKWFIHFLKGLKVIHSRSRIHFDIKLDNLFLVNNQLKIGDFEYYLKKEDYFKGSPFICGTPGYMAPELFLDRESVSGKCDIFSAGVAFCELFAGSERPFNLIQEENDMSDEEQGYFQELFGDKHLTIMNEGIKNLFIKNFRIFNFFKKQLEKKLETSKIHGNEHKIYELILNMVNIDPEARPDVEKLLFKTHEVVFDPESLIGQELVGNRYIVEYLIDAGGRGSVFKVLDNTEGEVKAIKLFPPQYNLIKKEFDQIKNELLQTRDLSHRNIVKFYGLERDGDLNFIVMEYINGFTLRKKLESSRGQKLKESEALKIMRQVASGLIEAHRNGAIHRNLKDTNIMIRTPDNMVKIINFGLSLKIKKSISVITGEGAMGSGTLLVAPPEQLQEILNEENKQTDVWGFGILLYQLLMGKIPSKMDLEKIQERHFTIAGISENTKTVMMKCLEKDWEKRYRNMEEVYEKLFGDQKIHEDSIVEYQGKVKPENKKKISLFFRQYKKRVILGLIFALITAVILIVLGTGIISSGQRYRMWYSGKPGNADTSGGGIGLAVSSDGIKWERYKGNPVFPHGKKGSFNEFESSQPFIVYDGNYFHMLFRGSKNNENGLDYQIGYTCTASLNRWDRYGLVKMTLDNGKIKFPGPMLYIDGYYKMWYSENDDVYYACTKSEGQSLSEMIKNGETPVLSKGNTGEWDKDGVVIGAILFEEKIYRMWYTGKSGEEIKIGYATSDDGINWNKHAGNPVFDDKGVTLEMNPCVLHDSKGYKMYYTAALGNEYYPVRLATSADGINWEKYSNVPVLDTGSADWEKSKVFVTAVKVEKK